MYDCAEWWRSRPLRFWDLSTITPSQIRAQLRRWHRDIGLRVVLFDYLQLADGEQRSGMGVTREREIAEVTKALKNSANDLGLTVIALAQLRRSAEERKTPLISDIKDCGEIEQAADQIILVKPWKPSEHGKDDFPTVQCILAKSRSSETGKFTLCLDKDWVVFRGEKKTAVTG